MPEKLLVLAPGLTLGPYSLVVGWLSAIIGMRLPSLITGQVGLPDKQSPAWLT